MRIRWKSLWSLLIIALILAALSIGIAQAFAHSFAEGGSPLIYIVSGTLSFSILLWMFWGEVCAFWRSLFREKQRFS
jgi:hypothetical protein